MMIQWAFGFNAWMVGFEWQRCRCGNRVFALHFGPVSLILHRERPPQQVFLVKPFKMPEFSEN